jgi:transcriptional regulator with XRE-family HTH domain
MDKSALKRIGSIIRDFRKSKGITQEKLAELASTTFSYIGGLERGERNVTIRTLEKVANSLQVELFDLLCHGTNHNKTISEINMLLMDLDQFNQTKALNILKEVFKKQK